MPNFYGLIKSRENILFKEVKIAENVLYFSFVKRNANNEFIVQNNEGKHNPPIWVFHDYPTSSTVFRLTGRLDSGLTDTILSADNPKVVCVFLQPGDEILAYVKENTGNIAVGDKLTYGDSGHVRPLAEGEFPMGIALESYTTSTDPLQLIKIEIL